MVMIELSHLGLPLRSLLILFLSFIVDLNLKLFLGPRKEFNLCTIFELHFFLLSVKLKLQHLNLQINLLGVACGLFLQGDFPCLLLLGDLIFKKHDFLCEVFYRPRKGDVEIVSVISNFRPHGLELLPLVNVVEFKDIHFRFPN